MISKECEQNFERHVIICVREAKADIEMDGGQEADPTILSK